MLLIGLDIGTTGCKATIFDAEGTVLAHASREYNIDIPQPSWAEQDPEQVWRMAYQAVGASYRSLGRTEPVSAIGLSVQGEAIIPVGKSGEALRPAILGMDTRTVLQNDWLRERFGAEHLFHHTGMPVHTINTLPKLLWLKENEPDLWAKASQFLLYEDFMIRKLTGQAAISHCLASRTQLYDLKNGNWSQIILSAIDLDATRLAHIFPSGTAIGEIKAELVNEWGFPNRPQVVTGGHDQACGALGVGLVETGLSMVSTGTAEVVEVALDSPHLNKELQQGNISVYRHVVSGLYLAMTLNHSGGLILRWFRDNFCQHEKSVAERTGADPYDLIFQSASDQPSSLLLLPHFAGSGTPHFDTKSKGALLGLTFATTRADVARAILEGLTFELRYNLEVLQKGGVCIKELRVIGGGARSQIWLKLKADITGIPVIMPKISEAASWGAAILAGVAVDIYDSPAAAVKQTLRFERTYQPNPNNRDQYEVRYHLYRQIYPLLANFLHQL